MHSREAAIIEIAIEARALREKAEALGCALAGNSIDADIAPFTNDILLEYAEMLDAIIAFERAAWRKQSQVTTAVINDAAR